MLNEHTRGVSKVSEYDRNYKWTDKSLSTSNDQLDFAGKKSVNMYPVHEPPLQRKRRVPVPSQGAYYDENVFLLGKSTEKFAPVVPYQPKKFDNDLTKTVKPDKVYPTSTFKEKSQPMKEENVNRIKKGDGHQKKTASHDQNYKTIKKAENNKNAQSQIRRAEAADRPVKSNPPIQSKSEKVNKEINSSEPQKTIPTVARQSEYQRNYNHEKVHSLQVQGPILTADDLFHRSRLSAPKPIKMPMSTEYRQQFKPYRFIAESDYKRKLAILDKHHVDNTVNEVNVRPVIVSSVKTRATTPPPRLSNEPYPSVEIDGKIYTAKTVLNPQRMAFPLGKYRKLRSEYQESFGKVWQDNNNDTATEQSKPINNNKGVQRVSWLDELMELRRRAEAYRLRSRGSHFSREHLAQLIAHENRLWNLPSDRSDQNIDNNTDEMTHHHQHHHDCRKNDPELLNLKDVEKSDEDSEDEDTNTIVSSRIPSSSSNSIVPRPKNNQNVTNKQKTKSKNPKAADTKLAWPSDYDENKYRSDSQYSSDVSSLDSRFDNNNKGQKPIQIQKKTKKPIKVNNNNNNNVPPSYYPPAGKPTLDVYPLADTSSVTHNGLWYSDADRGSISESSRSLTGNQHTQSVGYVFAGVKPPSDDHHTPAPPLMSERSNASSCGSNSTHSLALKTLELAKKRQKEFWKK